MTDYRKAWLDSEAHGRELEARAVAAESALATAKELFTEHARAPLPSSLCAVPRETIAHARRVLVAWRDATASAVSEHGYGCVDCEVAFLDVAKSTAIALAALKDLP